MDRELIINSTPHEIQIALLEDEQLVELHHENQKDNDFAVGDVYLARVRKILPGLNAAFIDVGYEKDAFLHYHDLGPQALSFNKYIKQLRNGEKDQKLFQKMQTEEDILKTGKIGKILKPNQNILVQIVKEPISSKGPRVSSEISFPGRYMVLLPFSDKVSISQKIKSTAEKKRLKRLISSIKPPNYGLIVRTMAEGKKVAELDADLRNLVAKWEKVQANVNQHTNPPVKVVSELDRTSSILRDLLNESFNAIKLNDRKIAEDIKTYIEQIAPGKSKLVHLLKDNKPVFEQVGIDRRIKASFGKVVTIKNGIYLVIEHTEAMHVIDVNSGNRVNKDNSQEENALQTNMAAAEEIARQLRLRDMGGIIVVDFIDMGLAANRKALHTHLKTVMAKDRARHTILAPSKFGLIQITRQRVRPEMNIDILEQCPACEGTGKVSPSILLLDEIKNKLSYLFKEQNERHLNVHLHPYVYAYVRSKCFHIQRQWFKAFKKWVKVQEDPSFHLLEYGIFNAKGYEIKI